MARIYVRQATEDDVTDLLLMCKDMVAASLFDYLGFDPRHFGEFCLNLLYTDTSCVLVAEQEGQVIGAILCNVSPSVTSPTLVGYEYGFYIRPQRRSLKAARMLLESYIEWAVKLGARRVTAGNSAGAPDEGFQKLLGRSGFSKAGSIMYVNT